MSPEKAASDIILYLKSSQEDLENIQEETLDIDSQSVPEKDQPPSPMTPAKSQADDDFLRTSTTQTTISTPDELDESSPLETEEKTKKTKKQIQSEKKKAPKVKKSRSTSSKKRSRSLDTVCIFLFFIFILFINCLGVHERIFKSQKRNVIPISK